MRINYGQLSKLSALRVVGRAAVAAFKSGRSDLPGMVKELGIGSLVTGTVREHGSHVRVNGELMDARSAQLIWSEQYDREGVDVFSAVIGHARAPPEEPAIASTDSTRVWRSVARP